MRFGPAAWGKRAALLPIGALAVAACGSTSAGSSSVPTQFDPSSFDTSSVSWLAANNNDSGTPPTTPTGTLIMEGAENADPSANMDPNGEYDTIGYTIMRMIARQLVTYPASTNFATATSLVADAATEVPTTANGGITDGGITYTFHIRTGMEWSDGTPVTAQDFELGLKRTCEPELAPLGNPGYYEATIQGFASFCTGLENLAGPGSTASSPVPATGAQRQAYLDGTSISGISTPDSQTLVITLTQPATDFLNIMAMPFASAAPPSTETLIPETTGNPIWSDGPYEVSDYDPGHEIVLTPNPHWGDSPSAVSWSDDPVRHRYVAEVDVRMDLASSAAESQVQEDILAGTADLEWNTVVPVSSLGSLSNFSDLRFGSFPAPGSMNPYLVFNTLSPNNGGALGKVAVRQALEYAIDKVAMGKIYGGAAYNLPLNQVFGAGTEGYIPNYDPYPTANNQGDPAKCKSMLAAAGYPHGLTLKDYYRTDGKHPAIFEEVKTDFAACGVTVDGVGIASGNYYTTSGIASAGAGDLQKGSWDITEPGWEPDWFAQPSAPTNARSILPDIFDGSLSFPGTDWGDYNDPTTNADVTAALAAPTLSQANADWQKANEQVMKDAAFIPFQEQNNNIMRSTRVHNAIYFPFSTYYDPTQIWLSAS